MTRTAGGVRRAGRALAVRAAWPLMVACVAAGCGGDEGRLIPSEPSAVPFASAVVDVPLPPASDETSLLDAAFRVDIQTIDAVFDLFPLESRASAEARVSFRMRARQLRPIFHFDPAGRLPLPALRLDGEPLAVADARDARIVSFEGSGQVSLELERDLEADALHELEASWSFPLTQTGRRFFADVNDILGRGNEAHFPTLNTPHELARHRLVFRVHASEPYLMVGSGRVTAREAADAQEWLLDSEREVASYTVMFHLAPAASHTFSERSLGGVDVRVLSPSGGVGAERVFSTLDPWLAELDQALGPFPMPRGLSVVLTQSGGGMEYYGATTTSLDALRHEVFHMYFGCSTVARTYRDSWWDEAIDMWYERSRTGLLIPIPDAYRSNIVNGRSAVARGFDTRAYDEGARVFEALAAELGGHERMVGFLRHLHGSRSFDPFTTWQLADELQAWSGVSAHERLRLWLYQGAAAAAAPARSPFAWLHEVDTTLPEAPR